MNETTLKTIDDRTGTRRVQIYQRANGSFGFEEWRFGIEEQCWFPTGRYSYAMIDTFENAEKEARSRVAWLAEQVDEV
jgi:hypothetical protein